MMEALGDVMINFTVEMEKLLGSRWCKMQSAICYRFDSVLPQGMSSSVALMTICCVYCCVFIHVA